MIGKIILAAVLLAIAAFGIWALVEHSLEWAGYYNEPEVKP
jgi:hypothetical protein